MARGESPTSPQNQFCSVVAPSPKTTSSANNANAVVQSKMEQQFETMLHFNEPATKLRNKEQRRRRRTAPQRSTQWQNHVPLKWRTIRKLRFIFHCILIVLIIATTGLADCCSLHWLHWNVSSGAHLSCKFLPLVKLLNSHVSLGWRYPP